MQLVDYQETYIAGVVVHAPWQQLFVEMPKAWRRVFELSPPTGAYVDVCLGALDGAYLQLVGLAIPSAKAAPEGLRAVHIPSQRLLHHTHRGPVGEIAASFGAMYRWAGEHGISASEFKLDFGYTPGGEESLHELYVGLLPEIPWRYA